jgi:hypothetical protein
VAPVFSLVIQKLPVPNLFYSAPNARRPLLLINPKPLEKMVESATLRLDAIKESHRWEEVGGCSSVNLGNEIGCLYNLFLLLAEEVKKLQVESNKLYGG